MIAHDLPSAAAPSKGSARFEWRATVAPASFTGLTIYALLLGAGLGLASAFLATNSDPPLGRVTIGPWTTWPRAGSREADPYMRAVNARRGDIPLAVGEGLVLRATSDSAGRTLDVGCSYRVGVTTPQARYWTLTLYDAAGRPAASAGRNAFTSAEVLRGAAGGFTIIVSREATSGSWMMMPENGPVSLVLRLYDTPAASGSAALDRASVPSIERGECLP